MAFGGTNTFSLAPTYELKHPPLPSTLNLLHSIQRSAILIINDEVAYSKPMSLDHRLAVGDLCLFYVLHIFQRLCSDELISISPLVITPLLLTRNSKNDIVSLSIVISAPFSESLINKLSITSLNTPNFGSTLKKCIPHNLYFRYYTERGVIVE